MERHRESEEEMKDEDARKLATEIAEELFTNGSGERAKRLVLEGENKRDLGGWHKDLVIERLTRWIQVPRKVKKVWVSRGR